MPRPNTVHDVLLEGAPEGAPAPANPEQAQESLEQLQFLGKPPEKMSNIPVAAERPKRRTKAELEARVAQLEGDIQSQQAAAQAKAPELIDAMKAPLKLTFTAVFNVMASWKGEHWKASESDVSLLAEGWAPCVGPLLSKYPEATLWAGAIACTYAVVYPRVQMDRTKAVEKAEAEKKAQAEIPAPKMEPRGMP